MHPQNKCPLMMCYNGAMKIKVVTLPTPFLLPGLRKFSPPHGDAEYTATWEGGINVYNREGVKRSTIVVTESYAFPLKSVLNLRTSLIESSEFGFMEKVVTFMEKVVTFMEKFYV